MKYKFIGKPDSRFPNLVTGDVYHLTIKKSPRGLFGFLVGNTKPIIVEPFNCPYSSWEAFFRNWELVESKYHIPILYAGMAERVDAKKLE